MKHLTMTGTCVHLKNVFCCTIELNSFNTSIVFNRNFDEIKYITFSLLLNDLLKSLGKCDEKSDRSTDLQSPNLSNLSTIECTRLGFFVWFVSHIAHVVNQKVEQK